MSRKCDLELRAKQEPLLEYWLEASDQFFGGFSPEILKCIKAPRFKRPRVLPPWSMQDHETMADTLWKIRTGLMQCLTAGCWPLKSPEVKGTEGVLRWVDRARSNLEELMYCQHRAVATTFVYYGRGQREAGKAEAFTTDPPV